MSSNRPALHPFPDIDVFTADSGEPSLRWGVMGPGWIAGMFLDALALNTTQRVVAVGSRSEDRAAAFAARHGVEKSVGSYEALVADPEVDVVYIATPPGEHLANGLLAIAAGKHVLIEKPLTATAAEAEQLLAAGREAGVLVMEAMWSRYLPQADLTRRLLADGVLGEIRHVLADHCQAIPAGPDHRLNRPEIGGGALLDLGIYPIQFDSLVLGAPTSIQATGGMTATGVDEFSTLVLGHGRAVSTLTTSMTTALSNRATIAGSHARLEFAGAFYTPTALTLIGSGHGQPSATWTDPTGITGMSGLSWQATAFAGYAAEGRTESPLHTHAETTSILATIDEARAQVAFGARVAAGS